MIRREIRGPGGKAHGRGMENRVHHQFPRNLGTQKKFLKQEGGRSREEARRPGRTADDPDIRLFSRRGDRTHRA